jgi:hypothetical protein
MRSDGDNDSSSAMQPVILGSHDTAPAQRLKGDVITVRERPGLLGTLFAQRTA